MYLSQIQCMSNLFLLGLRYQMYYCTCGLSFGFFLTLIQHYFHQFENLEAHCRIIAIPGQYFVPLLRSEDNSSQPFIGTPWSPESSRCGVNVPPMSWSPRDPLMAVKACAGPMTPSKVISTCSVVLFMDNS